MATSPWLRLQLHTWGRFTDDGRGFTYAFVCWALTPQLPLPAHFGGDSSPETYVLPMDDRRDDWLRLKAEAWARDHQDPDTSRKGRPHALVHTGGLVHPDPRLAHVRLGGTLHWAHAPHPMVSERLEWLRSLDFEGLCSHLCGPVEKVFAGVIQGER